MLSSHFQGTVFEPYSPHGTDTERRAFRPIGINRHNALAILQIRPGLPRPAAVQLASWSKIFVAREVAAYVTERSTRQYVLLVCTLLRAQ